MPSVAFFTPLLCGNRHTDRYKDCDLQLKERGKVKSFVNILARFGYDNINIFERKLQESESLGIDFTKNNIGGLERKIKNDISTL